MNTLALAVLIFQPLFFYRRHLFRLTAHIPFDIQSFHLPLSTFISRTVWNHEWPFWNPDVYAGGPIHADIQAQLFYPPAWIIILIDRLTGAGRLFYWLEWLIAVHMIIGGVGAYYLFREFRCSRLVSLFGATVFQIGPVFVSQSQHLGVICTAAWFPVVLFCLVRVAARPSFRWLGWLSLAMAMGLLAGFPAAFAVVAVLSGLFSFGLIDAGMGKARVLAYFAGGLLFSAGITAIQLIPTIQLSRYSIASIRYRWRGNGGGLPWESLVSFVWPNYYHIFSWWDPRLYKLPYNFTFLYTFCGHAAVVLVVISPFFLRKSRLLAISMALLIFSTIWMLGENTPIYPAIFKRLPHFVENFLYAEYALIGFSMFAAVAAALVLARFEPGVREAYRTKRLSRVVMVLIVAANSWNLIRIGANKGFNTADGSYAVATASWDDAGLAMPDTVRTWTRSTIPPLRVEFLSDAYLLLMACPLYELPTAAGDNPFLLLRYYELRRTFSDGYEWERRFYPRSLDTPWLRALNIGYIFEDRNSPTRAFDEKQFELTPLRSVRLYKVKDPLPRFYLQNRIVAVDNEEQAISRIKSAGFDPANEAIVEGLPDGWVPGDVTTGSVVVRNYENNRIDLDVETSGRAVLVTSEAFYPGWTARVNGHDAGIVPTNLAFRGIPLEAGQSHIEMHYFPQYFVLSVVISVLSLLGCFICLWW